MSKKRAFHKESSENTWQRKFDAVIAKSPPRITWRKNSRGIWVHTSINDPHAETGSVGRSRMRTAI